MTHDQSEAMGLGDRIAVMELGRVRQLAPPVEVYDDPADTFVATFLGSPPMNLVPRDGHLVGFRPEHLLPEDVVPGEDKIRVPFTVDRIEHLSGDRHLYGTVHRLGEETRVITRLPATVTLPVDLAKSTRSPLPRIACGSSMRALVSGRTHAVTRRLGMVQTTARRPDTQVAAGDRVGRRDRRGLADREGFLAWAMLLPSIVYIALLVGLPLLLAVAFSFSDVTAGDPSFDWNGLANYRQIFDDPVFWQSLRNTIIFTAGSMVLIVVFGKVLANILVADFHGKWIVRFLVLLPWTTPVALSAIAWLWMLDSIFSPIDWMLRQVGLINGNMYWLGRPNLALLSVIAVHAWRLIPLAAVIMMAGLVAIPNDIKEQAEVDGGGYWRRMFEITIPLMMPLIAVAALFGAIVTFTDMTVVYVLTVAARRTRHRCLRRGRSSEASKGATSRKARQWRCSSSRCCSPQPFSFSAQSVGWR